MPSRFCPAPASRAAVSVSSGRPGAGRNGGRRSRFPAADQKCVCAPGQRRPVAGALRTVQQQGEAYPPLTQSQSARQLARRDAHGVADVRDAVFREIFGLRQGGDGDGPCGETMQSRATSMLLQVLQCGRNATPRARRRSSRRAMLRRRRASSRSREGVGR